MGRPMLPLSVGVPIMGSPEPAAVRTDQFFFGQRGVDELGAVMEFLRTSPYPFSAILAGHIAIAATWRVWCTLCRDGHWCGP